MLRRLGFVKLATDGLRADAAAAGGQARQPAHALLAAPPDEFVDDAAALWDASPATGDGPATEPDEWWAALPNWCGYADDVDDDADVEDRYQTYVGAAPSPARPSVRRLARGSGPIETTLAHAGSIVVRAASPALDGPADVRPWWATDDDDEPSVCDVVDAPPTS